MWARQRRWLLEFRRRLTFGIQRSCGPRPCSTRSQSVANGAAGRRDQPPLRWRSVMKTSYRDLTCGDARPEHAGREVTLSGWVNRRRDMGQLIFIDLRDRYGITQVVIDAKAAPEAHATAVDVRNEFVLSIEGVLDKRMAGTENSKLPTGEMELRATAVRILSTAKPTPFPINDPDAFIDETLRLKHRYLDLRREQLNRR